ncbi:MAG: hypothetical protein O7D30_07520 [Rickettsia endosymbiont of Ixodes persulcatus]|nr:hypothetical protein [Rickettsia endosymbiont of Ixodes persulcatus]
MYSFYKSIIHNSFLKYKPARHFRQKYFFSPNNILNPYTWTFDHPEHIHLVLY